MQSSKSRSITNRPQAPTRNLLERKREVKKDTGNEAREERRSQVIWGKWSCEFRSVRVRSPTEWKYVYSRRENQELILECFCYYCQKWKTSCRGDWRTDWWYWRKTNEAKFSKSQEDHVSKRRKDSFNKFY